MRANSIFHPLAAACSRVLPLRAARYSALALFCAATLSAQLKVAPTTLPVGTVGTIYNVQLIATGGSGSYTWTWGGTPLPPGLNLQPSGSTAFITGTPTVVGSYPVAVSVHDTITSANQTFPYTIQIVTAGISVLTSPPGAIVGQAYSQALVSGGTAPYSATVTSGSLPGGMALGSTGVLSGTPSTSGTFKFTVQASDSSSPKQSATGSVTLTVTGAPLGITNPVGPLFNGTAGVTYTPTTFSAQGGTPPYTWSILSGQSDGLTMSAAGVLSGTPTNSGSFSFVVQVADQTGSTATQSFSIVINAPSLVITASSFPAGTVGVPYAQTSPAATASGGTAPYTWSVVSGLVPGLAFVPSSVAFSGTPTSPGSFSITLQVTDAAGLTATKSFTVTIAAATLTISGARQLSNATLNVAYSQQLTAVGGTPPYTWKANGLPTGLTINSSTGLISGTPTAAGNFPIIVITVIDSTLIPYQDNFSLAVNLPPVPSITLAGLPPTANAASQFPVQVNLSAGYSNDITGQLIIGFQANTGLTDSTIQFSTGGKTANFIISAGTTAATFLDNNGIPVGQLQIQMGTVAGSISVSLSNVNAAGVDITPVPAPTINTQIASAAPVITNVTVTSNGNGGCASGQICLQITGYATSREVTQAVYTFNAAAGQTLQSSAGSITVDVSQVFTTWFAASTIGSQFILSQPFTVQGSPASVIPTSVTLTNRVGSTTYQIQ